MASLKQVTYLREQDPETEATVFYIDLRTPGRYEQFMWKVRDDENVKLIRGKVALGAARLPGGGHRGRHHQRPQVKENFDLVIWPPAWYPPPERPLCAALSCLRLIIPELLLTVFGRLDESPLDVMKSNEDATGPPLKVSSA
jgi:quinone-modifying oxidoreductase subunit QmoA